MIAPMARVIALSAPALHAASSHAAREVLRRVIVCGCALALIGAGQVLPF